MHTTENYNGQLTGQEGIHALWETRLPLLFFDTYNLFVGQSVYIEDPLRHIWNIILDSYALVERLLMLEKKLSISYPAMQKYSFEQAGTLLKEQYSIPFATAYHLALQGQVEARLQQSIKAVGSFWLTAWINGGSPNLDDLATKDYEHKNLNIDYELNNIFKTEDILKGIRECGDSLEIAK